MRLDIYLFESGLVCSRTEAKRLIQNGCVFLDGKPITKPSFDLPSGFEGITVDSSSQRFASRGGFKLEFALNEFGIDVTGKRCLDVGASSGGFTDCLLSRGASHVIALDSGSGQLVESLRRDSRVTVIENCNARYMDSTLLRAEISYSFNQRGINCTAFKETEGSQCYIRGEEPTTQTGRILNFTIELPEASNEQQNDPELLAVYFEALISMLNQKGAGISQYNLCVKNAENVCVYLASIDLLTRDTVRLV